MKSVLISVHPKWWKKISTVIGHDERFKLIYEKSVEVRKTRPKLDVPFKVFVYETKAIDRSRLIVYIDGDEPSEYYKGCGKVVGEFICDAVIEWHEDARPPVPLIKTCLSYSQIRRYWGHKEKIFLWHISNLKIYDEPRELSEFRKPIDCHRGKDRENCIGCWDCEITRPPQSWCYVESEVQGE